MEFSEAGEYHRRPELNPKQPSQIFTYAKEMQRYLRERVSEHQLPESIDYVVEDLEGFISTNFQTLPELTIVSRDVYETTRLIQSKDGVYIIKTGPKPLDGDAALYGEHSLMGTLYGFHRGVNNDIRAYVANNEATQMLMGGIYTPLLSVGIEDSEIELTNISAQEHLDERGRYVSSLLSEYEDVVSDYIRQIIETLNSHDPIVARLQHVSPLLVQAAQHNDTSQQFIDAVTDIISLKLGFNVPQDIHTRQHRVVITEKPIPSYKLEEMGMFTNITPQLGLLGESAKRELGLFFLHDERAIQVPVKNITYIHRTQSE